MINSGLGTLSPKEKNIALALVQFVNKHTNYAHPSELTLCDDAEASPSTVARFKRKAEAAGILRIDQRGGGMYTRSGDNKVCGITCTYTLTVPVGIDLDAKPTRRTRQTRTPESAYEVANTLSTMTGFEAGSYPVKSDAIPCQKGADTLSNEGHTLSLVTDKPSIEPSKEPSIEPSNAEGARNGLEEKSPTVQNGRSEDLEEEIPDWGNIPSVAAPSVVSSTISPAVSMLPGPELVFDGRVFQVNTHKFEYLRTRFPTVNLLEEFHAADAHYASDPPVLRERRDVLIKWLGKASINA